MNNFKLENYSLCRTYPTPCKLYRNLHCKYIKRNKKTNNQTVAFVSKFVLPRKINNVC